MNKNINYKEIIIMLHLSKLIYNYHIDETFDLSINETIITYANRKSINSLDDELAAALYYLLINYPNGYIYNFISNSTTDIQVGIVLYCNTISIVFRGTDTITDWMYNCDFIKRHIELSDIEIHKGFFDQLMSIYDNLLSNIKKILLSNPNLDIYITGHSAGGAHGTILAYLLEKIYKNKIIKLITFGSPKVGNYEWYKIFNTIKNIIYYRVTNEGDIVTKIPNINYYHVGLNIHLLDDNIVIYNNMQELNSDTETNTETNSDIDNTNICIINNNCFNYGNYLNINNHKIVNYYNNFKTKENIYNDLLYNI